jgi:hypothetical protein
MLSWGKHHSTNYTALLGLLESSRDTLITTSLSLVSSLPLVLDTFEVAVATIANFQMDFLVT